MSRPLLAISMSLFLASSVAAQMAFEHVIVDASGPSHPWGKAVGDLNQDGRPDLIAGGHNGGGLVWYENPSWTRRIIAAGAGFSTDHELCDVDRDGRVDVVSIKGASLYWYRAPDWASHVIGTDEVHDIEVFDLDLDGDCDVVGRNQGNFGDSGDALFFYTQTDPTSWSLSKRSIVDGEGLASGDLDADGDLDLVVNGSWFQNEGGDPALWPAHVYSKQWTHPSTSAAVADIDGDGRQDILLSPSELESESYRISWFEAPADPTASNWTEHIVDPDVEAVHHFIGAADFDRDGDIDIASAEMTQGADPDEVKIYVNEGNSWRKVVISNSGSHSMRVVDIDLDGDMDLFGANWASSQLDLWVNQTPPDRSSLDHWRRLVIDGDRSERAIFIAFGDVDGDRRPDVVAGADWYRNPGTLPGVWEKSAIGAPLNNMALLHDFDADGDVDILGTAGVGAQENPDLVWGRNDGRGTFTILDNVDAGEGDFLQGAVVDRFTPGAPERIALSWHRSAGGVQALTLPEVAATDRWTVERLSSQTQHEALSSGDIDRDGDRDLLLGTVWLRNERGSWSAHTIFETPEAPDRNRLGDINRDGRLDAIVGYEAISSKGKLAWYEQPASTIGPWREHVIAEIVGPMSVDVADMDNDGDLDVVAGEHNLAAPDEARLIVFENADGLGGEWIPHKVFTGDEHHDGALAVDIDEDGDLDIVSIGWSHGRVVLYENRARSPIR